MQILMNFLQFRYQIYDFLFRGFGLLFVDLGCDVTGGLLQHHLAVLNDVFVIPTYASRIRFIIRA